MVREIGSEFWQVDKVKSDRVFLISGRTALDFIIRDILQEHDIRSALLPSYCCHTMIAPFIKNGIPVRFYDVFFDVDKGLSVCIPEIRENELFYYMTYFGFSHISGLDISSIRNQASIIIEDRTHSWMGSGALCEADYSYASYRKWTGFDGIASADKLNGTFRGRPNRDNMLFCSMRREAFEKKQDYIEHGRGCKQDFLSLFGKAEELLETDYVGYRPMDDTLVNFGLLNRAYISEKRRHNAQILIEGLKYFSETRLMFSELHEGEVPLFVPIIVERQRDELRWNLIDNDIYCPTHWPLSPLHDGISVLAKVLPQNELSVICDQRYNDNDMYKIVDCISGWCKR